MQAGHKNGAAYREGEVEANGLRIHYVEGGQGRPVLLLRGVDDLNLARFTDLLTQHNRVIALDVPGLGAAPAGSRTSPVRDLARTIGTVTERLGLDRFGLVSFTTGARAALWLALDAAERVDALVLVSPAAMAPEAYEPDRDIELEDRLGQLESPTLVLFGTGDEVIPPETGRRYKEQLPNCFLVFIYDAGHAVAAQRPEALAGVVTDFLERHETFIVSRTSNMINP